MSLLGIAFTLLGITAVSLNSFEIHLIRKRWLMLKPHDQLLLSLASSDLLIGLLTLTYGVLKLAIKAEVRDDTILIVLISTFTFTALNIAVIGADRYLSIRHPIKHRIWLTRRRMRFMIISMWTVVILFIALIPTLHEIFDKSGNSWVDYYFSWFGTDWILSVGTVIFFYYTMIIILVFKRRANLSSQSGSSEVRATKREISLMWTCLVSVCYFIISTFPFALSLKINGKTSKGLALLLLTNAVVNPVLYFFKAYVDKRRLQSVGAA